MTFDAGRSMIVVKCGASGHNIRSKPSLKGMPIGMLALGNTVTVQEYVSCYRLSKISAFFNIILYYVIILF